METIQTDIRSQSHADLTNRARGGIVVYLLGWLTISLPNRIEEQQPFFFYLNTAILILILVSRMAHFYTHRTRPAFPLKVARGWLVWTILIGALHWGMMSCWVLMNESFSHLNFLMIASTAVLGVAGTTALSIAREIRLLFPAFMLGPTILALLYRGQAGDFIAAAMVGLAFVYVFVTAKTASQDYWLAIENKALAEQHAVEMERLSVTDQLTQLKNRSYFDQRFSEEWKRGDRQNTALSLLMLDLDHFKSVNDNHGHVFGDACLQRVAQSLAAEIQRETDILARYGGEEFIILMPDTDALEAAVMGEKLRAAIARIELRQNGKPIRLTCSVGGATVQPDYHDNRELLLKQADQALYQAKADGRNRYQAIENAGAQALDTA